MTDLEKITRPGGIVPVDIETTGALVQEVLRLRAALEEVEKWWLEDGMSHFTGAPYAMFAVREALNPVN